MKKIILSLTLLSGSLAFGAIPSKTSTQGVAPQLGLYKSQAGFEISAGQTAWVQSTPPKGSRFIETVYKGLARNGVSPTLTVRVDESSKTKSIDQYMKKWMREYPRYGFDVTGSKPFKMGNNQGYVVDLVNRDKNRQLRQVVFYKDSKAVILTCRDQSEGFKTTLRDCNEIVKNFSWANVASSKIK